MSSKYTRISQITGERWDKSQRDRFMGPNPQAYKRSNRGAVEAALAEWEAEVEEDFVELDDLFKEICGDTEDDYNWSCLDKEGI